MSYPTEPPSPGEPEPPTGSDVPPAEGTAPPPPAYQAPAAPPPPPAYGSAPPPAYGATAPPPATGSSVDIGTAMSWAWAKFTKYVGVLVGLAAVVFLIRLIGALIQNAILNNLKGNCDNPAVTITGQNISITNCTVSLGQTITVGVLTGIVIGALAFLATVGVYRAALKTTLGEAPSFDHLTSSENLGAYIIVAIVFGMASVVGLVLCIIPGLIVIFLWQFAPFFALDKGQGVGEAFGSSYRVVTANVGPVLLAALVNIVASIVGGLFYGILVLVALPFAALFTAHVYRQLNHEQIAA